MVFLTTYGIQLIVLLQRAAWLELPARLFAFLGSEEFFFLVLPAIYWCIDAALGIRVAFILLFSTAFNEIAKLALHSPRPYWVSTQVKPLAAESSFGSPSGHAQIATGIWGTIAARLGRTWAWIIAGAMIFLVGLARMILAVHFPHDVLLGWLLGGVTLWAFLVLWDRTAAWLRSLSFTQQVLLAAAAAAIILLIHGSLVLALRGYVMPAEWMTNAARAGQPFPNPVSMDPALTAAGTLFGLALGLAWIVPRGGYRPSGPLWKRLLCFVVGLIGVLVLYLGLKLVFPPSTTLLGGILRFVRYVLIGAWVSAVAPVAFGLLRLTSLPRRAPR